MSDALTHVAIGDIIAKALAKSGNPYLNQKGELLMPFHRGPRLGRPGCGQYRRS